MLYEKGRPSQTEQLEIEKKLRSYFDRTVTASYAAKDSGINIKTVCRYFNKWSREIRESYEKDFLLRQREQRERIILGFDDLIFKEYQILDGIEDQINNCKIKNLEMPKYLITSFQDIIKSISALIEKKGLFTIELPPDKVIEQKIEEKLHHDTR